MAVTLEDLQGTYDINYQSSPPLENFYEPGFGAGKIEGNVLTGIDGLGVYWYATLSINEQGIISFEAELDPTGTPPNVILMDKTGNMSREKQQYSGIIKATKLDEALVLRTEVQQGPIMITVQFRKRV